MADATPIALTGHTRLRSQYGALIDQQLRGVTNYTVSFLTFYYLFIFGRR